MLNLRRTWVRVLLAVVNVAVVVSAVAWCVARPAVPTASPLSQVGDPLPPGAAKCRVIYQEIKEPFNAAARGTPLTSCPFAEQVRRTAHADGFSVKSPSTRLRVVSPTNRKWYEMQCISAERYATCTGGNDAVVYLFNTL
jgi:hypothetical protein